MGLLMFSIAIVAMNYPVILTIIAPSPPPKLSANQKQELKKMTNQVPGVRFSKIFTCEA